MNKETESVPVTLDDVKDFSNVCRTCATITDFVIPIFIGEGVQNKLAEKINKHLPIELSEEDVLPHVLCYQCASTLLAWHELVKCCVQADAALHQRLLGFDADVKVSNENQSQSIENGCKNNSKFKNTPESDVLSVEASEKTNTVPMKMCYFCKVEQPVTLYKEHLISIHPDRLFHCDECDNYIDSKEFVLHMSLHAVKYAEIHEQEKLLEKINKNKTKNAKNTDKNQNSGTKVITRFTNVKFGRCRVETSKSKSRKTRAILEDEFSDHDTEYFDELPMSVFQAIDDSENERTVNDSVLETQANSCDDNNHSADDTSISSQPTDTSQAESQMFLISEIEPQTEPDILATSDVEPHSLDLIKAVPGTSDTSTAAIIGNQPHDLDSSSSIIMENPSHTFDTRNAVLLGHQSHSFDTNTTVYMRQQPHTFDSRAAVFMRHQPHTLDTRNAVIMGHQPHSFDTSGAFIMRPQHDSLETSNAVIMIHQPHPFDTSSAVIMRPHMHTLDSGNAVIMIQQPQTFTDTGNALIMRHEPHTLDTSNALITMHQPHTMDASNAVIAIHQPHILESSEAVTVQLQPPTDRRDASTETHPANTLDTNHFGPAEQQPPPQDLSGATHTQQLSPAATSDATNETLGTHTVEKSKANTVINKKKERTCPVCLKVFTASSSYFYHIKHSHNNRRKDYECDVCKGRFISKESLQDHATIHTGACPYQCKECRKKFRSRASLYIHRQIHIGTKAHTCSQCNKAFRWRTQLGRHIKRHEAEKLHACATCGRGFSIHGDMLRHARTHHAGAYACDKCDNKFAQKRYLTEHMSRKHSTKKKKKS